MELVDITSNLLSIYLVSVLHDLHIFFFFFKGPAPPRDLLSSPPRPSSDLSPVCTPAIGAKRLLNILAPTFLKNEYEPLEVGCRLNCAGPSRPRGAEVGADFGRSAAGPQIGRAHV